MKKKLLATTLLATMVLGTASSAFAATYPQTKDTIGDVEFEAPTDENSEGGNPVAPEQGGDDKEPTDLIPVIPGEDGNPVIDGGYTNGALRLEFIPNFHFGKQANSSAHKWYEAIFPDANVQTATDPAATNQKAPIFAQVTDERGLADGKWQLSVKQATEFAQGEKKLANTRIQLYAAQIFNSNIADASSIVSNLVDYSSVSGRVGVEIPMGSDLPLMQTKASTNGSKTSYVFSDAATYNPEGTDLSRFVPATETNPGVKLFVPASDVTEAGVKYTANFTWTLSDTF